MQVRVGISIPSSYSNYCLITDQEKKLLDSKNYKDFVDKRGKIVNEFHEIIASVIEIIDGYGSTFTGKEDDIQNLLGDLKSKWNEIEKLSMQIEKLVVSETADEMEEQKEDIKTLNNQYADILFQAKYAASRKISKS